MAYRSRGSTNDEMIDKLMRFGIIDSPEMEQAFRKVDRRLFMPQNEEGWECAYRDEPHRQDGIHLSAPHIYATALSALELSESGIGSFLNIGSGTGYFSAIVSSWIGRYHQHYGVEAQENVVEHSRLSLSRWKSDHFVQILKGNAFDIAADSGEGRFGVDRIYVGAAVKQEDIPQIAALLKKGGVLVCPVEDEMVKVVRVRTCSKQGALPSTIGNRLPMLSDEFMVQVLSAVRFSRLQADVVLPQVVLPSLVWKPDVYKHFPSSFQESCKSLLLCSRASAIQPPPAPAPPALINHAATLPQSVWLEVLSYCHHDWFVPSSSTSESNERVWRGLLEQEQDARSQAENRIALLEQQLAVCARERDIFEAMAEQLQNRLGFSREHSRDALVDMQEAFDEILEEAIDEEDNNDEVDMDEDDDLDDVGFDESSSSDDDSTLAASPTLTSSEFGGRRTVSISEGDTVMFNASTNRP